MQSPAQSLEPDEDEGLTHDRYMAMWREWVDNYGDARKQHFKDEEYYDGDVKGTGEGHWTATELKILADRRQPPSVFNFIKDVVNAIAGVEQRSRSEPRALPRGPRHQKSSEIATDCLRYLKEQTRLPMISANGFLDALKIGYAASEISGDKDHVAETPIFWKDFFFDWRSRMFDYSDANYLGVAKWLDLEVAIQTYVPPEPEQPEIPPKPEDPAMLQPWARYVQGLIDRWNAEKARRQKIIEDLEATASGSALADQDYDEDDHSMCFGDPKRKRVFVVDMWHRDPKKGWYRCVFTGKGKLFTQAATRVEKDAWGRKVKVHPIKAFSLYCSKDGWRYGEIRGMRSPQDEVNMRRSKALHLLSVNQIINRTGNVAEDGGKETLRKEAARPDGYMEVPDPSMFRIEKNLDLAAGQQRLGEEARAFLETKGPNPQLRGEQGQASSGRALLALQQAGLGILGPIFDRFHDWEDRRYRGLWFCVQQEWTEPMYIRVTDDKNAARFAAVNGAPVIHQDNGNTPEAGIGHNGGPPMTPEDMMGGIGMGGAMPPQMPNGGPMMGAAGAMPPGMPGMGAPQPEQTGPMLAELDMDIIIDRAPEAATLQAEQFEELAKLAQTGMLGPPGNPDIARMLITASALPTKTELLDMLDKMAQQPQGPSPQEKAMLAKLAAEIERLTAQAQKDKAGAAKIAAEIPGAQADAAKTGAEARTANVEATMTEVSAANALAGFGSPMIDPLAAAAPSGAIGLSP